MLSDDELAKLAMGVFVDAPMQVLLVDRQLQIVYLSRFEKGFSRDDVIGRSVLEHIAEADQPAVREACRLAFEEGEKSSYETSVVTPEGSARYRTWVGPLRVDGEIRYASMMSHDISAEQATRTELAEQQRALRQSEERFRLIVERAPEAIVIFDTDAMRFVELNPRALDLFGRAKADLLTLGPADVSPEHQPDGSLSSEQARVHLESAASGSTPIFEWTFAYADGSPIECEVRLLRLPHSEHQWVRGSITDISARKRAEGENEKLSAQLAHAQRMQAVGQLAGGLAHDFNNLLTVVGASVALIELDPQNRAGVLRHARAVQQAVARAVELNQRMLAFSRQVSLRPRAVDVAILVREMKGLLVRTLGETTVVETNMPRDVWLCRADPGQLENALLNLAINARDAMPRGGRIRIAASNVTLAPGLGPDTPPPGDYVCLVVSDEGVGIPAQSLQKVVEPFFTTKPLGAGSSGLGLSMVYGFARQSGGHLTIDSEEGQGTSVSLYLPRSRAALGESTGEWDLPQVDALGSGEKVLIVEDEPLLRQVAEQLVAKLGFTPLSAANGPEAVLALELHRDLLLLITDMVLPGGMNGVELGKKAAELYPQLPVLYMSGYAPDLRRELDPDAAFLEKPFGLPGLEAAVRAVLDR
ncbi:MAG: PAS domain S-box protein [Deltaproteobacteria bacterium]|nr:PAS domain S-box protein [Deltaproteobacteria bacterium]